MKSKVTIIKCKYNETIFQSDVRDVNRIIRLEKPEIFHSQFYPMNICGALANSNITKHILHYHGSTFFNLAVRNYKVAMVAIRENIGDYLGAYHSNKIISISDFLSKEFTSKYRLKNCDKIIRLYNWVDLDRYNPSIDGGEVRSKYNINKEHPLLLCVGTISYLKGQHHLIQCMNLLKKYDVNIKLLIVGRIGIENPYYYHDLINKIEKLGLKNNIIVANFVDDADLSKYYGACDIFVSATQWEGFGLPFAEAMASGRPVIGFDRTAMAELICNGFNGFKVKYLDVDEFAKKIIYLIENPEITREMGKNARTFAEMNFNPVDNMNKLLSIYKDYL